MKKQGLKRAEILANCFLNMYTLKSGYCKELVNEIDNNCPDMFRKELRVPDFYLNVIKSKIT